MVNSAESRNNWVDYAKAIGIILVVYGHVVGGIYNAGIYIPDKLYTFSVSVIYSFHMPLFFFLSGVFFYNSFSKRGGGELILSKVDTVVYPYIVWSILQGTAQTILSSLANSNVTYSRVFSILWSPIGQFWFLYALFVLFCVATIIHSSFSKKIAVFMLPISAVAYVYQSLLPNNLLLGFISNNLVFFAFGIFFSFNGRVDKLSNILVVTFLGCVFILSQYLFHNTLGLDYTDKGIASLTLTLVSILFVISISSWASKSPSKWFTLIGISSMTIYLMHVLAGAASRIVLQKFMSVDSFVVHLIVGCIVGIISPIVALILINKFKIPYVFSAPVSNAINFVYKNHIQRMR